MSFLLSCYHDLRFGTGIDVDVDTQQQIELHLKKMEKGIRMAKDSAAS
jgi:hypothetical protein